MTKRLLNILTAFVMAVSLAGVLPGVSVEATSNTIYTPGEAYNTGKYIYYAYEMSGVRMGIMRLNTKTMKKKQIVSYKLNGNSTNGFYSLSEKGNYIYATWDQYYGTSGCKNYIYRFSKNGKYKKKLAMGSCPVIVGNYIYYIQEKKSSYGRTMPTGNIYRMKLNGTKKKKIKSNVSTPCILYKYQNTILYSLGYEVSDTLYKLNGEVLNTNNLKMIFTSYPYAYDNNSPKEIKSENYTYYVKESLSDYRKYFHKLFQKNIRTGKVKKIALFKDILSFRLCGNYIMIKTELKNNKFGLYCINVKNGAKKKLSSWIPGE